MNLYRMKNRLCWVVAAIGCCLLPFGCVQEEDETRVPEQGQEVSSQLQVRAAADNTGVRHLQQRKIKSTPSVCMLLHTSRMTPKTDVW